MDFREAFLLQMRTHKNYTPQDAGKLCFQAAFGPRHMLKDPDRALGYLENECRNLTSVKDPMYEEISPDLVRMNLRPWISEKLPVLWLFSLFQMTAEQWTDGDSAFRAYISSVRMICAEGATPFTLEEFDAWFREYCSGGIRAISHSSQYREANHPAYRLVAKRYLNLIPILSALVADPQIRVIAIDGMAGSGKTTLANDLRQVLGCGVVRMDDFFLPMELRTQDRMEEAGGNIHYERFQEEVIPFVSCQGGFSYRRFDCGIMDYGEPVSIEPGSLRIVEGSYCCHPAFGNYADLRIFVETDPATQMDRIARREIPDWMVDAFRDRWIPMENRYHNTFELRRNANVIINT